MAHLLVWLYHHGEFPEQELDHIDGNALNNRLENLRPVSRAENNRNASMRKDNPTGYSGVFFIKNTGKYQAVVRHSKQIYYLGTFTEVEEAAKVVATKRLELGYGPQHGK